MMGLETWVTCAKCNKALMKIDERWKGMSMEWAGFVLCINCIDQFDDAPNTKSDADDQPSPQTFNELVRRRSSRITEETLERGDAMDVGDRE